jgi:hypothetical protein
VFERKEENLNIVGEIEEEVDEDEWLQYFLLNFNSFKKKAKLTN